MKTIKLYPTQEEVRRVWEYRNGKLFWRIRPHPRSAFRPGDEVGSLRKGGYRGVKFQRQYYAIHRLVWIYHHGPIPDGMTINHRNEVKDDNRIENLELLTSRDNQLYSTQKRSTSGIPNVYPVDSRWRVQFANSSGDAKHYGCFPDIASAKARRNEVARELGLSEV